MTVAVVYDPENGQILEIRQANFRGAREHLEDLLSGQSFILADEVPDPEAEYVVEGNIRRRPPAHRFDNGPLYGSRLETARKRANDQLGRAIERARASWLTPLVGQDTVYRLKEDEALKFMADQLPDPSAYPLLSQEIAITGDSLEEVARTVLEKAASSREALGCIERIRLTQEKKIGQAVYQTDLEKIVKDANHSLVNTNSRNDT